MQQFCTSLYLAKLIAAGVCARDKIIHCVASTGLAALLLPGGRTAHSRFKIPIPCHEQCHIHKIVLSATPDLHSHVHQLRRTFAQVAVRTFWTSFYILLHSVPCTFDPSVLDSLLRFHRSCVQLQTQLRLYFSSISAFIRI